MTINSHDASMDPPSPTVGSPVKPTTPEKADLPPPKKQLSSAQKASLARAREKARQRKLAKSQAKAEQEKEFAKGTLTGQRSNGRRHDRERERAQP